MNTIRRMNGLGLILAGLLALSLIPAAMAQTRKTEVYADLCVEGNVGIGVSTPAKELDVQGDASISGDLSVDGTTLAVDGANNRVGIGTLSPATDLDVQGNASISGDLSVDGGTLTVDSTNNRVGVGTQTPRAALDIAPSNGEASLFGLDRIVGFNDLRFYADNTGTDMDFVIDTEGRAALGGNIVGEGLTIHQTEDRPAGAKFVMVGNDAFLTDINLSNGMAIYGNSDQAIGRLKLGSAGVVISGDSGGLGIDETDPEEKSTSTARFR